MNYVHILVVLSVAVFCRGAKRMVGGSDAPEGSAPHQVSLKIPGVGHHCGGSIISKNWILTAAHCTRVCKTRGCVIEYGTTTRGQGLKSRVERIYEHPHYSQVNGHNGLLRMVNDVSLLKVAKPLQLGNNVMAIRLNRGDVFVGQSGNITGWGDTGNKRFPSHLKIAKTTVVYCYINTSAYYYVFCVKSFHGSICNGDSGGPLVIGDTLAGVASVVGVGCPRGGFNLFVDISKYIPWIKEVTSNYR